MNKITVAIEKALKMVNDTGEMQVVYEDEITGKIDFVSRELWPYVPDAIRLYFVGKNFIKR